MSEMKSEKKRENKITNINIVALYTLRVYRIIAIFIQVITVSKLPLTYICGDTFGFVIFLDTMSHLSALVTLYESVHRLSHIWHMRRIFKLILDTTL